MSQLRQVEGRRNSKLIPSGIFFQWWQPQMYSGPLADVRVRRALNLATDRRRLIGIWGGRQRARPTCQVLPQRIRGYQPYCPYTAQADLAGGLWRAPDLARARRLAAEAGANRDDVVTVAVNADDPVRVATAQYFTQLLRQLGFPSRLRRYPDLQTVYSEAGKRRSQTDVAVAGWASDFPRASDFFSNLLTCESYQPAGEFNLNLSGFCDPGLDRQINRARALATQDPAASAGLWARVDRRVVDRAPWVAFVNRAGLELTSKRIGNYQRNPQFGVLLEQLWVR